MARRIVPAALVLTVLLSTGVAQAQGPLRRAGRALDNAGKNIRNTVESAIARGEITAQERQLLDHVSMRINLDRRLLGSTMQLIVEPGGVVFLRGSVADKAARALAVDLAGNTVGVTRVVDELGIVEETRVIDPAGAPAGTVPAGALPPDLPVLPEPTAAPLPAPLPGDKPVQSEVIIKPR